MIGAADDRRVPDAVGADGRGAVVPVELDAAPMSAGRVGLVVLIALAVASASRCTPPGSGALARTAGAIVGRARAWYERARARPRRSSPCVRLAAVARRPGWRWPAGCSSWLCWPAVARLRRLADCDQPAVPPLAGAGAAGLSVTAGLAVPVACPSGSGREPTGHGRDGAARRPTTTTTAADRRRPATTTTAPTTTTTVRADLAHAPPPTPAGACRRARSVRRRPPSTRSWSRRATRSGRSPSTKRAGASSSPTGGP